jgi:hypothetical protein
MLGLVRRKCTPPTTPAPPQRRHSAATAPPTARPRQPPRPRRGPLQAAPGAAVRPVQAPQPGKLGERCCRPPQAGPAGLLEPSIRVACGTTGSLTSPGMRQCHSGGGDCGHGCCCFGCSSGFGFSRLSRPRSHSTYGCGRTDGDAPWGGSMERG